MRTVSNTFCALVVLAGYLWGGCINCEQLLLSRDAMPDCCHHGQCDRASHGSSNPQDPPPDSTQSCEKMAWSQAPPQDTRTLVSQDRTHAAAESLDIPDLVPALDDPRSAVSLLNPIGVSPPDLPTLHASLLI